MNNFCIIFIIVIIIILIVNSKCFNFNIFECMFNEDKLFKRNIYGNNYIIGYDKCSN